MEFRLPELGEGIADATVVNLSVKAGDRIAPGQALLEVETDKAAMPVPATFDGTVVEVRVKAGDKIKIGQAILEYATAVGAKSKPAESKPAAAPPAPLKKQAEAPAAKAVESAPAQVELKLPPLGEGIEGGTIVSIAVKVGDVVAKDQELFTVETDKAAVPIPSTADGKIIELRLKSGDKIAVGAVVALVMSTSSAPVATSEKKAAPAAALANAESPAKTSTATATTTAARSNEATNGVSKQSVPAGPATRRLRANSALPYNKSPAALAAGV